MGIILDKFDRNLLYQLDGNARLSTSELARTLKQGRDRVEYRLTRLKELGILKGCTVTINPYRLGLTLYKTYLKLSQKHTAFEKIIKYLTDHPRVYWIADCDGRWDLIFSTFARSPFEFHAIQHEILDRFSDLIISSNVFTLVNVWVNRLGYLVGEGAPSFVIGGEPSEQIIDPIEWKILRLLSKDARMPISEIARQVKTTEMVVRYRLEGLEKSGLILGYRASVNLEKLGMMFFKAQIYLKELNKQELKVFRKYCQNHPNITFFIEQIGECDIEIELEVDSYQTYTEVINEIRKRFSRLIRNIETVLINDAFFKWVPLEFASQE